MSSKNVMKIDCSDMLAEFKKNNWCTENDELDNALEVQQQRNESKKMITTSKE